MAEQTRTEGHGLVTLALTRAEAEEIRHAVPSGRDADCEVCERHASIQAKLRSALDTEGADRD